MSNSHCRPISVVMWTGLAWLLILAPACAQSDRPHGATDAAQAKGDAEMPDVPIPVGNDAGHPGNSGADASHPSLDGYWDLVSTYDNATGTATPFASGTAVVHYNGGVVEIYMNDGANKGCASNTYTVQGTTITYAYGTPNSFTVTDTMLRLTSPQAGGTSAGYSDFIRLATFSADGYGTCQSANSGADAGQPSLDGHVGPAGADGPVAPAADASRPSLDGYWDVVSTSKKATGTTTPVGSGTTVVHFNGGVVELYSNNAGTKTCGSSTYTLQGTTITYVGGNTDSLAVTDTTLRLTTLQAGGAFGNMPGDYSDFIRLATFNADAYGTCVGGASGGAGGGSAVDGAAGSGGAEGTGGAGGSSKVCNATDTAGCQAQVPEGCGDGKNNQNGIEQCDDGNVLPGDGCNGLCRVEPYWTCPSAGPCLRTVVCGDGAIGAGEVCDDGNTLDTDGCNSTCTIQDPAYLCIAGQPCVRGSQLGRCGDGIIQPPEQCDDGNLLNNGDYGGCAPSCIYAPHCGDGIKNGPERCDDGTNDGSYGSCTPQCKLAPHCGDGIVNGPEECDHGDQNGLDGKCTAWCKQIVYVPS
jgi:cysteine-rich repeat protein